MIPEENVDHALRYVRDTYSLDQTGAPLPLTVEVPAETLQEQTVQIGELIATVRAMEAKADAAARKRVAKPRKPLASTEAYVSITVAVCLLVAFIAYLYYTH